MERTRHKKPGRRARPSFDCVCSCAAESDDDLEIVVVTDPVEHTVAESEHGGILSYRLEVGVELSVNAIGESVDHDIRAGDTTLGKKPLNLSTGIPDEIAACDVFLGCCVLPDNEDSGASVGAAPVEFGTPFHAEAAKRRVVREVGEKRCKGWRGTRVELHRSSPVVVFWNYNVFPIVNIFKS
jgi:hypothetical protein